MTATRDNSEHSEAPPPPPVGVWQHDCVWRDPQNHRPRSPIEDDSNYTDAHFNAWIEQQQKAFATVVDYEVIRSIPSELHAATMNELVLGHSETSPAHYDHVSFRDQDVKVTVAISVTMKVAHVTLPWRQLYRVVSRRAASYISDFLNSPLLYQG